MFYLNFKTTIYHDERFVVFSNDNNNNTFTCYITIIYTMPMAMSYTIDLFYVCTNYYFTNDTLYTLVK